MLTYIKTVFTKPKEIYIGRNMKRSHFLLFILLMAGILSIMSIFESMPAFNQLTDDYQEIRTSIPEFNLDNNQLESEEKTYVYQTPSLVFYFDPDGEIETDTIDRNMNTQSAPISIALLDQKMYFNFLGIGYPFPYSDYESLTSENILDALDSMGNYSLTTYLAFIVILLLMNIFLYLSQLLPITLFAHLISTFRRTGLRFMQNAKIAVLASIIPFLLVGLVNIFGIYIDIQFEITFVMSLFIFYISITELKNRIQKQN